MRPVNILVVDDNEAVRNIMRIVLSIEPEIGEVREAGDGASAIEMCGDFAPDLVLLDYWMPEMDGAAAAATIRAMHPDARIVAFSAVLDDLPEWADHRISKDELPEAGMLVRMARGEPEEER